MPLRIPLLQILNTFPDDEAARQWFERVRWKDGLICPCCGSTNVSPAPNKKPLPYWCADCRRHFSVRTGTPMHRSKLPLRKWAIAIFLLTTNPKGIPSTRLAEYLDVTQRTAWFMGHRIREGWMQGEAMIEGPVEVDETYVGGLERNKHWRKKQNLGRGFKGTYHFWNRRHLHRYVQEFVGRHNTRLLGTAERMGTVVRGFEGKRLTWAKLTN